MGDGFVPFMQHIRAFRGVASGADGQRDSLVVECDGGLGVFVDDLQEAATSPDVMGFLG